MLILENKRQNKMMQNREFTQYGRHFSLLLYQLIFETISMSLK